jgi:diguanylate cyclase (GGDEF)-like protein
MYNFPIMEFHITLPAILFAIATLIVAIVTVIAWKRRQSRASSVMAWMLLAITGWTLTTGMETLVIDLNDKITWSKFEYLFASITTPLLIAFSTLYTNRQEWLNRKILMLFWSIPVITILLTFTNEYHHLIWTGFTPIPGPYNLYVYYHGPMFWIFIAYIYTSLTLVLGFFIRDYTQAHNLYRRQFGYLILALLFPFITGTLYLLEYNPIPGLDITPLSFSITAIIIGQGFLKDKFSELIPVARTTLLETLNDGILVLNIQDRLLDSNLAATRLFGWKEFPAGEKIAALLDPWPDLAEWIHQPTNGAFEIALSENPPLFVDVRQSPITNRLGRRLGRVVTIHDITQRKLIEADLLAKSSEMERLSITDELTGLYNRRYAQQTIEKEICACTEHHQPLTIAMFDLDDFKSINDNFGHHQGDLALKNVGALMFENLRESDTAARMGGDEFIIILPRTNIDQAYSILERLSQKLVEAYPTPIRISVGVTSYIDGEPVENMLKRADNSLYKAKELGKNQIVISA